jgi:hypothetical protein
MNTRVRNLVRARAQDRCEYCRLPETVVEVRHVIDHIIPRHHRGDDELSNLALACANCNRHKGTDLTGIDPVTSAITALFNPRRDAWHEHFAWSGLYVLGQTPIGRTTVVTLAMNSRLQLIIRRATIDEWPSEAADVS